ncbi:DUF4384 domain-containing protein [Deinococcus sp. MIMF12]|uniref:DUF4384 domain-containing protein n=1 Tax=Deinococcus rhizophilus TaxID=3049544 RepID=A0ABT7JJG5_9DEIO|nr:DUF4384 domain-containing protein [Deinococcus rhizophilus]MDL2345086.1 DUF4384 domain-containing protein [Deinococcus rhizophilus]
MKKPALILALTASVFSSLALPAQAAPKLSTQSIIVNPVPTTLEGRVWVDRDTSGTRTPTYRIGDRIRLSVSVNENAYVYLFCLSPDGTVDQIFPNRLGSGNYVRKGEVRSFPSNSDNFVFNVGGPAGLNKVLLITSRRQLNLSELSTFSAGDAFATVKPQGSQQLAQALSIVVNPIAQPLPQQDWISDVAFFNAVR